MERAFCRQRHCFILSCVAVLLWSCSSREEVQRQEGPVVETELRIGEVTRLIVLRAGRVWGYGIVGRLAGTGSDSCPDRIRVYLQRTIPKATASTVGLDRLIASANSAVVQIEGVIPPGALESDLFDLSITAVDNTNGGSLQGGWLYPADLRLGQGISGTPSPVVASAQGPLYLDKLDPSETSTDRSGHILGGGRVTSKPSVILIVNEPSFGMAGAVRNAINQRFGPGTAKALSPERVELSVPKQYRLSRDRFFAVVNGLYLDRRQAWLRQRAEYWAGQLAQSNASNAAEIALEGMGRAGMTALAGFLSHPEKRVRLSAARCLGSLGAAQAIEVLAGMATEANDVALRREAIAALALSPHSPQLDKAVELLLNDDDFNIVLETYEKIVVPHDRGTQGINMSRWAIGRSFTLDLIPHGRRQAVVATRKGIARIALFGTPVRCRQGYQLHSESTGITVDTRGQESLLTLSREGSSAWRAFGPIRWERRLSSLIRKFGEEPDPESPWEGGLGLAYDEILALLKDMCDANIVNAEFWAGPLPRIHDL